MADLDEKYLEINRSIMNFNDKILFLLRNYDYHVKKTPDTILKEYKKILQQIEKSGNQTINAYNEMKTLLEETRKMVNRFNADIMQTIQDMGWDKSVLDVPSDVSEDDSESEEELNEACGTTKREDLSGLEELQQSVEQNNDYENEIYSSPDEEKVFISKTCSSIGEAAYTPMVKSDRKQKQ